MNTFGASMRNLLLRSVALLVALATTGGAQSWCLAPGDSSASQVMRLTGVMTPSDSTWAHVRATLGLTALDTTDMQLVTTDSICIRVDSAVMRAGSVQVLVPRVVYRLGTNRYAAFAPGYSFLYVFFIDDHYEVVLMII